MLNPRAELVDLFRAIVDIESVSGNERALADELESALRGLGHLEVVRNGDALVARTNLGRAERVVIAGHIDTVPLAGNLPSREEIVAGERRLVGRGTADMKGGVAVQLAVAAAVSEPVRDVTWIFYDHEEVEAALNGLGRIAQEVPGALEGDFAVLLEPTDAVIEGGCQGTLRAAVTVRGLAAHSARSWLGRNAIHAAEDILARLNDHVAARVEVDGLEYREGLNAVAISGGIAGNVIPDACTVTVNYRFAPDKDERAALAEVERVFEGFEVELTDVAAGARPGLDRPIAAQFVSAVGGEVHAKYGWTDVSRFSALGVPAVNFGPGNPGKAHADDEYCPVDQLYFCRDALVRWLTAR